GRSGRPHGQGPCTHQSGALRTMTGCQVKAAHTNSRMESPQKTLGGSDGPFMKSACTAGTSFATGGDCSHPRARSGTRTATAAIDFVFMPHLRPLDEYNRRHVDQPQRPRDDAPFPVIRVGPGIEREGPWSLQAIAHRAARPTIAARALCLNRDLPRGLDVLCRRREGERLRRIVASVAARGVKLTDAAW